MGSTIRGSPVKACNGRAHFYLSCRRGRQRIRPLQGFRQSPHLSPRLRSQRNASSLRCLSVPMECCDSILRARGGEATDRL